MFRSMPRPPDGQRLLPVLALLVVVVLAACSGASGAGNGVATLESPDPSGDATEPEASLDPQEALLEFAACMREHGVDMPDPQLDGSGRVQVGIGGPGGGRFQPEELEAAMEACRDLMPGGGPGGGGPSMSQEDQDRILEFAQCMRDHGIDFPDPQFSDGGGVIRIGPGGAQPNFDPEDPEFQEAQEACEHHLPGGGEGPRFETNGGGSGDDGGASLNLESES